MITIKTPKEIALMREGGRILARVLQRVIKAAKPGVPTKDLDKLAERLIRDYGGEPAFLNYQVKGEESRPFPAALCTSVDYEVVHSIPRAEKVIREGNIIGLDIGILYKGFCTDTAKTIGINRISTEAKKLIAVTRKALYLGIKQVKPGNYIGDIGAKIQEYVEKEGYSVVKQLVGHGIGRNIHEEPRIPNFGEPKSGSRIKTGMTLAIEPMVNVGEETIKETSDDWTIITSDKSLSAHFEHTVAVTDNGYKILTQV